MIVVGGVVPAAGYEALKPPGRGDLPPGTVIAEAAGTLLSALNRRLGHGQEAAE